MYIGSAAKTTIYLGSSATGANSTTYARGDLYYQGDIWCYNGTKHQMGYTGEA
jgi:hypothetical protein